MSKIAGIDYSITCPAVCIDGEKYFAMPNGKKFERFYLNKSIEILQNKGKNDVQSEVERYNHMANGICNFLIVNNVDMVHIEDYSYGSVGKVFHIAENMGVLKYKLWEFGISYKVFAPSALKKFATGKGNADKMKMFDAYLSDTGIDLRQTFITKSVKNLAKPIDDLVDAYYLSKIDASLSNDFK